VIAARVEQARSVADVLLRRTRLGLVAARELLEGDAAQAVARLLGEELGWSESRITAEREEWGRVAEAEGLDPAGIPAQ
jgi:glycerol-3-phosphate dehydrogenase